MFYEDLTPSSGQKSWKRPASASESERRIAENRRVLSHAFSGSDGEKDRRYLLLSNLQNSYVLKHCCHLTTIPDSTENLVHELIKS